MIYSINSLGTCEWKTKNVSYVDLDNVLCKRDAVCESSRTKESFFGNNCFSLKTGTCITGQTSV